MSVYLMRLIKYNPVYKKLYNDMPVISFLMIRFFSFTFFLNYRLRKNHWFYYFTMARIKFLIA